MSLPLVAQAPSGPRQDYFIKAVCESADRIVTLRFGPDGARIERTTETRLLQSDISGPHGIVFSPDRKSFYVSMGHGRPYGSAVKYEAEGDRALGQVQLGMFPATSDVSPDGNFLYVVNFNLHGDPVPSSVSVVDTTVMLELARIPTCVMPHGSRVARDGTRQYSGCMMDDLLVEIDAQRMKVARSFRLGKGHEQGYSGLPPAGGDHTGHPAGSHDAPMNMSSATCQPTWAQPSVDGRHVYVACNKSDEIVDIDAEKWAVSRRIPAGTGVYNLAVSPDGKLLVATNKRGASVSLFDLATGTELAKLPTKRKVVHGVAVSPDSRYAFVTVEGIGSEPGTIEVIDLGNRTTVAEVDTPPQAAGIDFWKIEPLR
ncbi:MAG TPA: YncE family protein [Methylomirabilota bacterium]|nr:YncE family protein [Methylomirabilota bacterium]